jgi:diguanylate cyclase (GGDEF)-like protein/PAS domain S-box-containing protein
VSVVVPALLIVVGMAVVASEIVAGQLRQAATDSARQNVEAIVRGYVDPSISERDLDLGAARNPSVDAQLERLIAAGEILRINIWSRDGRVVYSTEAELRGQRFSIGEDLALAFSGLTVAMYEGAAEEAEGGEPGGKPGQEEPHGLVLEVYVPIRGTTDGNPFGVYEVYEDAGPIEERVAAGKNDVFLVALVAATSLLGLVLLAFAGSSSLLRRQNRLLREQAAHEQVLTDGLRKSEERFRSLVRNSSDGIMIARDDSTITYESPGVERVLGYAPEARVGRPAFELVHEDDIRGVRRLFRDVALLPDMEVTAEFRARHADGSWRVVEAVAKNLLKDPAIGGIVVNYRDVTDRRSLEQQLRHQAFHDSLTGLPNRALFLDRLAHSVARTRRGHDPLAVVFIDLDDFKAVNDSLGHAAGDELLVAVAGRIRMTVRESDTPARMGGDEFAILLEDAPTVEAARESATRVLEALRLPFRLQRQDMAIRASAGIAMYASPEQSADELLRNADISMYSAKAQGKDRLVVYESAVHDAAIWRLQLRQDLQLALEHEEFALVYQPLVDLETNEITGVEALLRWQHPRRGLVGPTEFVPIAEETGLIVPIGRWVLERACLQAREWRAARGGRGLDLSVNLSGRQIEDPELVDDVRRALEKADLEPRRLTLELTESILMHDAERTIETLGRLRGLGVRLAIDDFGTGYSSLSYLRQLPVDALKIDRSFVAVVDSGPDEAALVRSIVSLAQSLRLETIAEGIEQPGQLAELRSIGTRLGQGYLFARPLESSEITELVEGGGVHSSVIDASAPAPHRSAGRPSNGRRSAARRSTSHAAATRREVP